MHIVAYAKALEKLSGVALCKLLPIPDISNERFPEARKHMDRGEHLKLYRFSPNDYGLCDQIWNGDHPEDGKPLTVHNGSRDGAAVPDLDAEPRLNAPGGPDASDLDPEALAYYASKIFGAGITDDIKKRNEATAAAAPAAPPKKKGGKR